MGSSQSVSLATLTNLIQVLCHATTHWRSHPYGNQISLRLLPLFHLGRYGWCLTVRCLGLACHDYVGDGPVAQDGGSNYKY